MICVLLALSFVPTYGARAEGYAHNPWSVSLYFGPSSQKYFGAVIQSGRLQPSGGMLGVAANGRLLYLGYGISLAAEGQITGYFFGHKNASVAFGLGFQVNAPFGIEHTAFSVYDGPSYAFDPPYTAIYYKSLVVPSYRIKFLNYVSMEYAVELPNSQHWDGVFRFYHRSGAWGLYNKNDDDGIAVGLGVRYRF